MDQSTTPKSSAVPIGSQRPTTPSQPDATSCLRMRPITVIARHVGVCVQRLSLSIVYSRAVHVVSALPPFSWPSDTPVWVGTLCVSITR